MAGKLIPMRELRALAKRAGYSLREVGCAKAASGGWEFAIGIPRALLAPGESDPAVTFGGIEYMYLRGILAKGLGKTKRAAQIQARENTKKVLLCVLTLEYGEPEEGE